ncbi:efflux RND transporter periplasmic adaptor subunit [Arenibacter aquaticus]|uniref:Efflux RND transporter periplasmic adaptor subunit n=1 Tax=Arenibacter aquaticus TaxID=2489054 RepID=A0A430JZ07_9FLAO|nr:efflux RND transporter periplasmic adaptor subunit [Arenibacter aquaticus]RTE51916.1 efflux RND transporter periplasmic adaptor subunit [Arenibacter aquaticus]
MLHIQHTSFLIILLLSITGCGETKTANNTPKNLEENEQHQTTITISQDQFEGENMILGKLETQNFPTLVSVTGAIDVPPQNRAIVSSFTGGYIKRTPLLIGDKVKKGQALITLENPEFVQLQQDYLEVAEQLTYLKSEFERQEKLVAEQISSEKNFLKAKSSYKQNLAMYNGLRKKLQMLNISPNKVEQGILVSQVTIYAPISGSITKVNVNKGMYVSPADEIMEIINTDHIHLELSVFEKDILKIKKNQQIRFTIPEASPTYFEAAVYLVGTSIDPDSRTVKVHGHLHHDENYNFAVGMFVEANIITEEKSLLALPNEGVLTMDEKQYVLTVNSQDDQHLILEAKEVKVGDSYNGYTALTDIGNLKKNDQFVVQGGFNILGESGGHDH